MIKKFLFIVTFFIGVGLGWLLSTMFKNDSKIIVTDICTGKVELIKETEPIIIDRVYYGDNFKLKDYSNVEFKFVSGAEVLIQDVRNFHKVPSYIKEDKYEEGLCAGYIRTITQKLRGKMSPYYIGMKHPEKQVPSKARELPYSYYYRGGKIIWDMGDIPEIRNNLKKYWDFAKIKDIKNIFLNAFSEENLLGDIGFLYKESNHFDDIGIYGNYNSHITKNFGISNFEYTVINIGSDSIDTLFETLECNKNIGSKIKGILDNYNISLNGNRIIFKENKFYKLININQLGEEISFKYLDKIDIKDVTIVHFNSGPKVDSLFQIVCQGNYYPINVININPKFIEKR